jgi:transposase InsO family protein
LRRHGELDPEESAKHRPCEQFEMEQPNQLWQMDFKGYFPLTCGGYCHPLTVLDDHSRYLLGLQACPNETHTTVQSQLSAIFHCYGLPERILVDNGSPWGDDAHTRHTILTAWLIRLGIAISHSRPYHPQTMGKDERLHRTLQAELIGRRSLSTLDECQLEFDRWRQVYNTERPHEALALEPPAYRYQPSPRLFPEHLAPVVYDVGEVVRKVDVASRISFLNRPFRVGKAFRRQPVAIRPTEIDGEFDVLFCTQRVAQISFH